MYRRKQSHQEQDAISHGEQEPFLNGLPQSDQHNHYLNRGHDAIPIQNCDQSNPRIESTQSNDRQQDRVSIPFVNYETNTKQMRYQDNQLDSNFNVEPSRTDDKTRFRDYATNRQSRTYFQQSQGDGIEFGTNNGTFSRTTVDLSDHESFNRTDYINYTIQPGDTLQNLSVKYCCPVASIKRLNHIWSDHEFYARSRLKLPAGRFRLLADVLTNDNSSAKATPVKQSYVEPQAESNTIIGDSNSNKQGTLISGYDHEQNQFDNDHIKHSEDVFKNLDEKVAKARDAALSYDAHGSDLMKTLAETGNIIDDDIGNEARREAQTLLVDMSDSDLSYSGLILFMFIVCLICPLGFVIYLEETSSL